MKLKLMLLSFILLLGIISCNNNVNYEYGVKHKNGRHYYDGNIDTVTYIYEEHFKIKYKLSHDTCYIFDDNNNLISTSINTGGSLLDPNFIYVTISHNKLINDTADNLDVVIEENNIKRNLNFSYNIRGPFPIFKIKKTSQYFRLLYKKSDYKIEVDSNYVFLYLTVDQKKHLKCNYRDNRPLER